MAVTRKDMNVTPQTETVHTDPVPVETEQQELARLRKENSDLRARLGEVGADTRPHRPSFGLSEGERADLELHGETNSPWTGERLTAESQGVKRSEGTKKVPDVAFNDGAKTEK